MKRVALLMLLCVAANASAQKPAMRKVEFRGQLNDRASFRVWNLAGSVRVTGWDKDSVWVRGAVPVGIEFFCGGKGAAAKCGVDLPSKEDGNVPGATLEVMVPMHTQLWLKSASADLTISNFDGDLDAYSVSGDLHVSGAPRDATLETMAGNLVADVKGETMRAKTASGSLSITGVVEDLEASTVSGNITVQGSYERGRFEAVDGDITWSGPIGEHATLDFGSHSGTVRLLLPRNSGGDFTISTVQGTVSNDFGSSGFASARAPGNREVHFVLRGDDRARVTIRNFKGKTIVTER